MSQSHRLPTLEGYLSGRVQESSDSAGSIIAAANSCKQAYRESTRIPANYQLFKPQQAAAKGLLNKLCYSNSLSLANAAPDLYHLAIGYLVAKKPNSAGYTETTPHAFNVEISTGRVLDQTLGKYTRDHYVGRLVSPQELVKLTDGGEVQDLLYDETHP